VAHSDPRLQRLTFTRRRLLQMGAGVAGVGLLGACSSPSDEDLAQQADQQASESPAGTGGGGGGTLVMLSTQLRPVEEAEAMRSQILSGFDTSVEFVPDNPGPFADRLAAEAQGGQGEVGIVAGQHGDLAGPARAGLLTDLSDLAEELADRNFNTDYLELGRYGTDQQLFIPWMQATYIMAARREALEFLPGGADVNALTYDDWAAWGQAIQEGTGSQRLGFPAGEDGLIHRFFEGYTYPSYTGALNTAFTSDGAVQMWEWMRSAWAAASPQSLTYAFMQEPLLSGEVWVAWDQVARLLDALNSDPENFVAFPAPSGPEGLGFLPVIVGLAIPTSSPDPDAARELIRYLTMPETSATTLQAVGFFPPTAEIEVPDDVEPGVQAEAEAVAAQTSAENAIPALLPVGLGEQEGAYNAVFRTAFERIVVNNEEIAAVLSEQAQAAQEILDATEAPCWPPDPESDGTCQVA